MIRSTRSCEKVNSEKIEDVFADVVETEEATADEERQREEPEEPESKGGELVVVQQRVPAKSGAKEPTERTDVFRHRSPISIPQFEFSGMRSGKNSLKPNPPSPRLASSVLKSRV
jgi:hypothetical protein